MTKLQEKAQAQVKQMVGQMIGDDRLAQEGRQQLQKTNQSENAQPKDAQPKDEEERARTLNKVNSDRSAPREQRREPATRKEPAPE